MSKNKLGQEPAFPPTFKESFEAQLNSTKQPWGISKRLYVACAIAQGMLSNNLMIGQMSDEAFKYLVERSYKCADELLKQENE